MVLHGRDADLAVLDETLTAARGGRGRALFVTGEAGIGKSTLLAEARSRAGDAAVPSRPSAHSCVYARRRCCAR